MGTIMNLVLDTCALIWWSLDPDKLSLLADVISIIPIDENLWLKSVALEWGHKDPADRIIVALAKQYNASIITKDQKIREFYPSVIW
jgi:PIN domain nuclease of toxin-antitoxin system